MTTATTPAAVLIGPPGAGKSTVGPLVAQRLGVAFCDTDERVEAVAGKPVADIFIEDGEQAFRALEREAVAWAIAGGAGPGGGAALAGGTPAGGTPGRGTPAGGTPAGGTPAGCVVGLGGGAVLDPGTQRLLAGLPVVYLATGFAAAAKRVGMDVPRPLLAGNPRGMLRALLEQRLPVYEKLARITVSTDGRDPGDIADDVTAQITRLRP
jgi:shikimate kinase